MLGITLSHVDAIQGLLAIKNKNYALHYDYSANGVF